MSHSILPFMAVLMLLSPTMTNAGTLAMFTDKIKLIFLASNDDMDEEDSSTSQNIQLLKPGNVDISSLVEAEAGEASSSEVLQATSGPLRVSTEDIDFPTSETISVYEVKKGDSLSAVAKLFNVSKNTIIWANDLKSQSIAPGDTLVILPMTGIKHAVKKGDSVDSIAKKYKADADDIAKFNGIARDSDLSIGDIVLVPEGEIVVTSNVKAKSGKLITKSRLLDVYKYSTPSGVLIRPVNGGHKTQGLHGHNGIDIGAVTGTPVIASAGGRVILAKTGGYNGGYGSMVILSHEGGIQTIYAHLNKVNVSAGQTVRQGQAIGEVGNTGRSTGPHLHFEVRGAKNPF